MLDAMSLSRADHHLPGRPRHLLSSCSYDRPARSVPGQPREGGISGTAAQAPQLVSAGVDHDASTANADNSGGAAIAATGAEQQAACLWQLQGQEDGGHCHFMKAAIRRGRISACRVLGDPFHQGYGLSVRVTAQQRRKWQERGGALKPSP